MKVVLLEFVLLMAGPKWSCAICSLQRMARDWAAGRKDIGLGPKSFCRCVKGNLRVIVCSRTYSNMCQAQRTWEGERGEKGEGGRERGERERVRREGRRGEGGGVVRAEKVMGGGSIQGKCRDWFEEHTKSCERLKTRLCSLAMTTARIVVLWPAKTAMGLEGT